MNVDDVFTDEMFMQTALVMAEKSLRKGLLPVGAVIVGNCGVINKSSKTGCGHPHTDHAEYNVINQILEQGDRKDLRGLTIYTTLEPGIMCFGKILNLRISRVVYALEDPYSGALYSFAPDTFPPRHKRDFPAITSGVLREESLIMFKWFFKNNKSRYWRDKINELFTLCSEQ